MDVPAKNIVICSDGTGNSYGGTASNVLRLYRLALKCHPNQIACYDPGIGTLPLPSGRTRLTRRLRHLQALSFGTGAIENVTELYQYLMEHYRSHDRIFLFGFSRGAFTVRALAGMIHVCGLLRWEDRHLVPYAAGLYQTSEDRIKSERGSRMLPDQFPPEQINHVFLDEDARRFKALVGRKCTIDFMGIWDTVKAYGWLWPQSFPALRHNPNVQTVRHAVSLDERRSFFQVTRWADCHEDLKEVWFAGDHADVGGGHDHGNSPLTDAALAWMLGEASQAGLLIDEDSRRKVKTLKMRSQSAWSTEKHDLWAHGEWMLDWIPRVELDNERYPPTRRPKIGPTGERKLGAMDKGPAAERADGRDLLVHSTVKRRGQEYDPACRPEALLARTAHPQDTKIVWVEDFEITGFKKGSERNQTA